MNRRKRIPRDWRPLLEPHPAWEGLPDEVRQRVLDLLALLCIEALKEQDLMTQEPPHEPR